MKGVLLAGGLGTRLRPITSVTNKHLLPVFDKPMVFYPLQKMAEAGIKEVLVITGPESAGDFLKILGSGREFGLRLTYRLQDEAGGIAQALGMAEDFAAGGSVFVLLGDNIFEDSFAPFVGEYERSGGKGAMIFLKGVSDPERFGVASLEGEKVVSIVEKPKSPKSNLAVTGGYIFDSGVFSVIKALKPSARGELEITDVNNDYIKRGEMKAKVLQSFWSDAGTFKSLLAASNHFAQKK